MSRDQDVRRRDNVPRLPRLGQELEQIGFDQSVVDAPLRRLRKHFRRKIDADQVAGDAAKGNAG